jgi:hypothetical protein
MADKTKFAPADTLVDHVHNVDEVCRFAGRLSGPSIRILLRDLGGTLTHAEVCYDDRTAGPGKVLPVGCKDALLRNLTAIPTRRLIARITDEGTP